MGSGGVPSGGTYNFYGRVGSLSRTGKPNSRVDLFQNGEKIQSRWYNAEGKAKRNRDFKHGDGSNTHTFPHDHNWTWDGEKGQREKTPLVPDYDNFF